MDDEVGDEDVQDGVPDEVEQDEADDESPAIAVEQTAPAASSLRTRFMVLNQFDFSSVMAGLLGVGSPCLIPSTLTSGCGPPASIRLA